MINKIKELIKKGDTWKIAKSKIETIPNIDKVELWELNIDALDDYEYIYNIKIKGKRKPIKVKIIFTNGIINIEEL